jgi:hypothetical protein
VDAVELAYVAGIVDGEGCIAIRFANPTGSMRSVSYSAVVTVGNTSRALIEYLVSLYAVGCVTYRAPTKTRRSSYLWTIESRKAREVIAPLRPYLVVKRAQADVLMDFVDNFDSFKGARLGHKGGMRIGAEELARRRALYEQMRALNRVGPRHGELRLTDGRKSIGVTAEFIREGHST